MVRPELARTSVIEVKSEARDSIFQSWYDKTSIGPYEMLYPLSNWHLKVIFKVIFGGSWWLLNSNTY